MGLKSFLVDQGFIQDDSSDKQKKQDKSTKSQSSTEVAPTYFPIQPSGDDNSDAAGGTEPSFVTPLQDNSSKREQIDPSFVKFFEDELAKSNLPGPDYFEFRQLLIKTQQKMASKGMTAPEVVLQAVLTSFEAQGVGPAKLIEAARRYKEIIKGKKEDFLKGAAGEKNNQLQKRQSALQQRNDSIAKIQQQLQQLEQQRQQLEAALNKEKTQMDVDKTLGKEGIDKIERAERLIATAHDYMQSNIDADIKRLESL